MDDWELLSDDGLVDFYVQTHKSVSPTSRSNRLYHFEDDYFSPNPSIEPRIVPVPIHFNPTDDEEVTKLPIESSVVPPEKEDASINNNNQVFFIKTKETDQFVDMKTDSPKGTMFEDQSDAVSETPKIETEAVGWEEESGGVNIWKWGLSGIGALCSFGVAVCIIILGSHQKQQQNHKARFQIYATDKRIKQVVHQATRLNEVISGTRGGVQLARAHISYGGYYDSV